MAVLPLCVVPPVLPRVAVVMGSDSDLPTMEPAAAIRRELGVKVEVRVLSAHRTPLEMVNFAQAARDQGFGVIVAGAGGAAHLPWHGGRPHHPARDRRAGEKPGPVRG